MDSDALPPKEKGAGDPAVRSRVLDVRVWALGIGVCGVGGAGDPVVRLSFNPKPQILDPPSKKPEHNTILDHFGVDLEPRIPHPKL